MHAYAGVNAVCFTEGSLDQIHWPDLYPACGGRKQSPIDIQRRNVQFNPHMLQLEMTGYGEVKNGNFLMTNNGHSGECLSPYFIHTVSMLNGYNWFSGLLASQEIIDFNRLDENMPQSLRYLLF